MKVGFYIGEPSPHWGGAYTYITEVISALSRARHDFSHELIICHHNGGEEIARLYPELASLNLDRERMELQSLGESTLKWDGKDDIYLRNRIHFIVELFPAPWSATSDNISFATTVWDLQHRNNPWFPEVSHHQEWEHRERGYTSLRKAAFIYTGTQQGRMDVASFYQIPAERIRVLPFAAPAFARRAGDQARAPEVLNRFSLPPDYIFYPAQFWPHKNHVLLLEACAILRHTTGWDLNVVFCGSDKGNLDYVRAYASRLGVEGQTRFLGFVDQVELVELYRGAFCLAFPTFFGPDNIPPLEAFSIGCPVLASDVPGAREQLGDAAVYFPPVDEKSLADAILSLRNPETRERLILAGRARADQNTWDDYAQGILESLDKFEAVRRTWP
jgi:glycosyltransferase involved in cell wall biosynthesis